MKVSKRANFRGNEAKERLIMGAIAPLLNNDNEEVLRMFDVIKRQAEY